MLEDIDFDDDVQQIGQHKTGVNVLYNEEVVLELSFFLKKKTSKNYTFVCRRFQQYDGRTWTSLDPTYTLADISTFKMLENHEYVLICFFFFFWNIDEIIQILKQVIRKWPTIAYA